MALAAFCGLLASDRCLFCGIDSITLLRLLDTIDVPLPMSISHVHYTPDGQGDNDGTWTGDGGSGRPPSAKQGTVLCIHVSS